MISHAHDQPFLDSFGPLAVAWIGAVESCTCSPPVFSAWGDPDLLEVRRVRCPRRKRGGLTPVEDQQLAGLMMWIPGALVYLYLGARAVLFVQRLKSLGRRQHDASFPRSSPDERTP